MSEPKTKKPAAKKAAPKRAAKKAAPKAAPKAEAPAVETVVPLTKADVSVLLQRARSLRAGLHVPHPGEPRTGDKWAALADAARALADVAGELAAYHRPAEGA